MRYARIALANMLPHLHYPLSGYINPLPAHLVPFAIHTAYMVCTDLHMCTCYMSFIPVLPRTSHLAVPLCYV